VSEGCGIVVNTDMNDAENIRQKILLTLNCDGDVSDRNRVWIAQPAVFLYAKSTRRVLESFDVCEL
jgi:putative transposase